MPRETRPPSDSESVPKCPACNGPICEELEGCSTVVLFFRNDEDRAEFIAEMRAAKPHMISKPVR